MSDARDPVSLYSQLSNVHVPPDKSNEIWNRIAQSVETVGNYPKPKKHFRSLGTWIAACVAIIVVGAGIYAFRSSLESSPSNTVATDNTVQFDKPAEVVSAHWRVVIMHTLLKQGPYYDILLYYKGATAIPTSGLTYNWGGALIGSSGDGQPIQPGSSAGGFVGGSFPNGFTNSPPLKVSWSQQGRNYSETLALSNAKQDLKVENRHLYSGKDSQWTVSYEYQTIIGNDFQQSYGVLVVTRNGKQIGNELSYTLNSSAGSQQRMKFQNPGGNSIRVDVNPAQKGYDITGKTAKITIQWSSGTDTITLNQTS